MTELAYTIQELKKILAFNDDMLRGEIEDFISELEEEFEKNELEMEGSIGS